MTTREELEAALAESLGAPVRVLARRPCPYASSFPLEELDVETAAGDRHALVFKDVGTTTLLADAERARRSAAVDPSRERRAYELLASLDLGTPKLIGAARRGDRAWLFLERIEGTRLDQVGDLAAWRAVAGWLAQAHARLSAADWPPPWRAPDAATLRAGAHGTRRRRIQALARPLKAAQARLAATPLATIHGELYPANVVIADDGRVRVFDWETIARGPVLLDLAALTAGRWDDPGEPLAEAYRRALPDPPPAGELLAELDACRLLVAAAQLAAPQDWTPPREQARDWLADAELVAERVAERARP